MTKEQVIKLMKSSKNREEWNQNAARVKLACGGQYPDYWHQTIITVVLVQTSIYW